MNVTISDTKTSPSDQTAVQAQGLWRPGLIQWPALEQRVVMINRCSLPPKVVAAGSITLRHLNGYLDSGRKKKDWNLSAHAMHLPVLIWGAERLYILLCIYYSSTNRLDSRKLKYNPTQADRIPEYRWLVSPTKVPRPCIGPAKGQESILIFS